MKIKSGLTRRRFIKGSLASTLVPFVAGSLGQAEESLPGISTQSSNSSQIDVIALNRLTFGPRPGDFEKFHELGGSNQKRLHNFLEKQLNPGQIDDTVCEKKIKEADFTTLHKSLPQLWADHVVAADRLKDASRGKSTDMSHEGNGGTPKKSDQASDKKDENHLRTLPVSELENATWIRALYSERQLFERVVNFWHDHFNVYGWEGKISPSFVHYDRDVIRKHAFGNFREMLEDVAKSPSMLLYLDNAINQSGNPNENYARELFELHTLGAENYLGTRDRNTVPDFKTGHPEFYVDGDVYEAARCFTGWRIDQGKNSKNTGLFDYFEEWHDRFQKIVLGRPLKEYQPPLKDGNDVLDTLASHVGTSRYIARKICRRFVKDDPSKHLVEGAAKIFHNERNSKDQLRQVMRYVFQSDDFKNSWGQKMKRPLNMVASVLRATQAEFMFTEGFRGSFEKTGQRLFQCRTPDGYPDTQEKWANTNSMLERWRIIEQIFAGTLAGVKIQIEDLLPHGPGDMGAERVLAHWNTLFIGRKLSPQTYAAIVTFLKNGKLGEHRLSGALALLFMSPDLQWG